MLFVAQKRLCAAVFLILKGDDLKATQQS